MISLFWALILALIAPFFWALSNVLDKYVVSHRVRDVKSYVAVTAMVYILLGLGMGIFLDWSTVTLGDLIFPAISGAVLGISIIFYFIIMQKHDASHVIGLVYLYPLIVSVLSFLFLGERLTPIGYFGIILVIFGALLLSVRLGGANLRKIFAMMAIVIFCSAFYEFFLKLAADNISILHGLAINEFFVGLSASLIFIRRDVRKGFFKEIGKMKWAFMSEGIILLSIAMTYASLVLLPVAFVSGVAAIQPLAVLILESGAHRYFGKMRRDHMTGKKVVAISVMVLGIILLYISAPGL